MGRTPGTTTSTAPILINVCSQATDDLADDLWHVVPDLRHGAAGEERRVVVVAAELAHHEQRLGQVAPAIYTHPRRGGADGTTGSGCRGGHCSKSCR
ncbi:Os05g0209683 [Oryza sativa Japonica Group]|uniref:Os05g0209683 protein n=1 Tax=Oryza sativa subsp. japonica TaxID=39947 RepID=A0A0P0WJB6_ORYSJ|nr:hypothetical protein EE612_027811 [Oryza sativa]BAS92784.1 Os05g0209683 [Oryza sativa Japonica Group]